MANVQSAFGFRQIGYLSGGAPDYQLATRAIQSTNTTKIYWGDPVIKSGAYIVQDTSTSTTILEGIFQGCVYTPSGGTATWSPYWPGAAAVDATAYIINAPNALFLAAALNTAISSSAVGNNISFNIGTGSTVGGGFSGATVDQSTITTNVASAAFFPFQIVGLYNGIGNGSDPTTPFNWVILTFNNQRFRTTTPVA